MLNDLITGKQPKPRKTLLYGTEGIGKSTFMSQFPDAVFISTEDGLADIDCTRFPEAKSFTSVNGAIVELYTQDHDFKTLVIDSVEGLERLIFAKVCDDHGKDSIEDFGYGKGYQFAVTAWQSILEGLDALNRKGMHIGLIGHAKIERFESPEFDSYDRYSVRINKHAAALLMEWSTEVLFASYKTTTTKEDKGFGQSKTRAIGTGQRVIRTNARPAYQAKNRLNLPDELALDFSVYRGFLEGKENAEKKTK